MVHSLPFVQSSTATRAPTAVRWRRTIRVTGSGRRMLPRSASLVLSLAGGVDRPRSPPTPSAVAAAPRSLPSSCSPRSWPRSSGSSASPHLRAPHGARGGCRAARHPVRTRDDGHWAGSPAAPPVHGADAVTASDAVILTRGADAWPQKPFPCDPTGGVAVTYCPRSVRRARRASHTPQRRLLTGVTGLAWLRGGSSVVVRHVEMDLDGWDRADRLARDNAVGRGLATGAPVTRRGLHTAPDLALVGPPRSGPQSWVPRFPGRPSGITSPGIARRMNLSKCGTVKAA